MQQRTVRGPVFAEEAGERISYVSQFDAIHAGLPVAGGDWWLLDSSRLARMEFDETGAPMGGEIVSNPNVVVQHCLWRDIALRHSSGRDDPTTPA